MSSARTNDDALRLVLIVVAVLVLAPVLMMVLAVPMMGMWGGMMGGFGGSVVAPGWTMLLSVVWLLVLLGGGYLLIRWLSGRDGIGADPAMEELRLAYARGDLSDEEFEERRSKLKRE